MTEIIHNPHIELSEAKEAAKNIIDAAAGQARTRYITTTPGQVATYLEKLSDAEKYVAANYPLVGGVVDAAEYAWLSQEVVALTDSAIDFGGIAPGKYAADAVIAQNAIWRVVGASIEGERTKRKRLIDNATDYAGINFHKWQGVNNLNVI
jgi:hypothetical protein